MGRYSANMGNIQAAYRALSNSRNPMQAFMQMAAQNPNLQPIANALRNGADPQSLFRSLCQQRGIDPNEFMRALNGQNG